MSKTKSLAHKATEAQEQAKKEISELQQKIEKINTLSGIVKKRDVFESKKKELEGFLSAVQQDKDFFSNQNFKVKFQQGEYSRDDVFSISNPLIIEKSVKFFIDLFNAEIEKQDQEIENLMEL